MRKIESLSFLILPTTCWQYYHRLHCCHGIFFTHPSLPEVWPSSQNFWTRKLTIFKKSTLNANWMYTLWIPFMCSSAFVLLVFSIIVTLCIAFQGAIWVFPRQGKLIKFRKFVVPELKAFTRTLKWQLHPLGVQSKAQQVFPHRKNRKSSCTA